MTITNNFPLLITNLQEIKLGSFRAKRFEAKKSSFGTHGTVQNLITLLLSSQIFVHCLHFILGRQIRIWARQTCETPLL